MFDGSRTTKNGHSIQLIAHSHIQRGGMRDMQLFDFLIDGKVLRGKAFRRLNPRIGKGISLGMQLRLPSEWKDHEHIREIKFSLRSVLMGDAIIRDRFPEHPANGHYIIHGTDELNEKYRKNKPKGVIRL